jgi:hypothetical protein
MLVVLGRGMTKAVSRRSLRYERGGIGDFAGLASDQ